MGRVAYGFSQGRLPFLASQQVFCVKPRLNTAPSEIAAESLRELAILMSITDERSCRHSMMIPPPLSISLMSCVEPSPLAVRFEIHAQIVQVRGVT